MAKVPKAARLARAVVADQCPAPTPDPAGKRETARAADLRSRKQKLARHIERRVEIIAELDRAAAGLAASLEHIAVLDGKIAALGQGEGVRLAGTAAADPREWQRRLNRYLGLRFARFPAFANLQFWRANGAPEPDWAARERELAAAMAIVDDTRRN